MGERYYDGGHSRRAHVRCAEDVAAGRKREPTRAEMRELEEAESEVSWAKGRVYARVPGAHVGLDSAIGRVEDLQEIWAQPEVADHA